MIFDYERRIHALEARVQALEDALKKEQPGTCRADTGENTGT